MSDELKQCPKCKENGAPTRRVNDAGKYCVECVECYEARTPWFDDQNIAEGYWMAISDDATLNLMKIAALKESEASLVERLNEQRRYTGEAVKEDDRLRARNAELESILKETVALYGKPGGPWNVPSDPGGWIEKARKALGKDHE